MPYPRLQIQVNVLNLHVHVLHLFETMVFYRLHLPLRVLKQKQS